MIRNPSVRRLTTALSLTLAAANLPLSTFAQTVADAPVDPDLAGAVLESTALESEIVSVVTVVKEKKKRNRLTGKQRRELYAEGYVTDREGNVWRIAIIPGTQRIGQSMKEAAQDAGDRVEESGRQLGKIPGHLDDYFEKGYWKKIGDWNGDRWSDARGEVRAFVRNTGRSFSVPAKDFAADVKHDRDEYRRKMREAGETRQTGWRAMQLFHTLGFATHFLAEVIELPLETSFRLADTTVRDGIPAVVQTAAIPTGSGIWVMAPVGKAVGRTTAAVALTAYAIGVDLGVRGAIVPGAVFAWQQPAWLLTAFDDVPTRPTSWVYPVDSKETGNRKRPQPVVYTLTDEALKSMIVAGILRTQAEGENAELRAEIARLRARIQELEAEHRRKLGEVAAAEDKVQDELTRRAGELAQRPELKAEAEISARAYRADRREIPQDIREKVADDAAIGALVESLARGLGEELSPEARAAVVARVRGTLKAMAGN